MGRARMMVKVTWTEEWQRTAEVDVDEQELADWLNHPAPFTAEEVKDWLTETGAGDPDGWMRNIQPSTVADEFLWSDVEKVVRADPEDTRLLQPRGVEEVVVSL